MSKAEAELEGGGTHPPSVVCDLDACLCVEGSIPPNLDFSDINRHASGVGIEAVVKQLARQGQGTQDNVG